jgi:hypothetical protein
MLEGRAKATAAAIAEQLRIRFQGSGLDKLRAAEGSFEMCVF